MFIIILVAIINNNDKLFLLLKYTESSHIYLFGYCNYFQQLQIFVPVIIGDYLPYASATLYDFEWFSSKFTTALSDLWWVLHLCLEQLFAALSLSLSHLLATYVTQPIIRSRFSTANYMSHCWWERERAIEWRVQIDRRERLSLSLSLHLFMIIILLNHIFIIIIVKKNEGAGVWSLWVFPENIRNHSHHDNYVSRRQFVLQLLHIIEAN